MAKLKRVTSEESYWNHSGQIKTKNLKLNKEFKLAGDWMFDWILCAMLFILNSTAGSDAAAVKSFANLQTVSQQKPATYQGTAVGNGLDESGFKQGSVSPHLIGLDFMINRCFSPACQIITSI